MNDPYVKGKVKVVLFNGPPRSGKDSAVKHLCYKYDQFVQLEFKRKLNKLVMEIYDISEKELVELSKDENKDKPSSLLGGISLRTAQKFVSEVVIKPNYGKDYFGKSSTRKLVPGKVNLFSDSGFSSEVDVLKEIVGPDNILIVRITRDGYDFSNDSRNYVYDKEVKSVHLHNHTLEQYLPLVESTLKELEFWNV